MLHFQKEIIKIQYNHLREYTYETIIVPQVIF